MALPPNDPTNDAFVREVDEEYRRQKMLDFWKKWGRFGAIALVAGLAGFAIYLYLGTHRNDASGKQGEQLTAALDAVKAGKAATAEPELAKLVAEGKPGYRVAALFSQADLLAAKGDLKGAAAKFGQAAGDASLPQAYRDYALVQQTRLEFDTVKPQAVIDRLKPLVEAGSPWLGSAGEMTAIAYLKLGKRTEAGKLFSRVAQDKDVPDNIRQRALDMAGAYGDTGQAEEKKAK